VLNRAATPPRIERRTIKVTLPAVLDSDVYHDMLDKGWTLAETRISGATIRYVFTRPGRPKPGDVESRGNHA